MKMIFLEVLSVAVLFLLMNRVWAQGGGEYCVFEQMNSNKVISRIDWLSVAKCSDGGLLAGGGLQSIKQGLSFAEAAALVDAMRVNLGTSSSGEQDRFHSRCDHSYQVWKRTDGGSPSKAYTHADANPGPGYAPDVSHLCCEDAAALVFPKTGNDDCRSFELMSVPGALVTLRNGHWVSSAPHTAIPSHPPINLSSASGDSSAPSSLQNVGTWHECETLSSEICGTWTWNASKKQFDAQWANGAKAHLKLDRFESDSVVVTRDDHAGVSAGMMATYVGQRSGNSISGNVTWTYRGGMHKGTWRAEIR